MHHRLFLAASCREDSRVSDALRSEISRRLFPKPVCLSFFCHSSLITHY
ncbi:MAG: hypothetical protein K2M54_11005 [Muribaculaceae bacterium]|nr:hypothetical protein [Muribaculaceae bacterium]MDE7457901.1 hypothetical protein [Muribaculaceae bacterium]